MSDYIDREAAFGVIRAENLAVHFDSVKDGLHNRVKRAQERYIASIPAADVAPVVKGKWRDGGKSVFSRIARFSGVLSAIGIISISRAFARTAGQGWTRRASDMAEKRYLNAELIKAMLVAALIEHENGDA